MVILLVVSTRTATTGEAGASGGVGTFVRIGDDQLDQALAPRSKLEGDGGGDDEDDNNPVPSTNSASFKRRLNALRFIGNAVVVVAAVLPVVLFALPTSWFKAKIRNL